MAKDKKKKKKTKKPGTVGVAAGKASKSLRTLSRNPLVADVVAAALVATASALKDSKKARQLAASAGDELESLASEGAERGHAMWQLALDIGRKALDEIAGEAKASKRSRMPSAKAGRKSATARKKARKSTTNPGK